MAMLKKRTKTSEPAIPVDADAGAPTSSQVQLVRRLMEESTPPSGTYVSGRVLMDTLVDGVRCRLVREQPTPTPITLSPREREIARMISRGLPNKSIAQALEISVWTVGTYLRRIFSKLGVTSRAAMVAKVMEGGILDQEPGEPTPPPMRAVEISEAVRTTSTAKVRPAPWR
jgi:two-component system, NarL family, nitrate/nitrite response regulator NarL